MTVPLLEQLQNSGLEVEDRGAVRWILFNRPEAHNAQNPKMLEALQLTLEDTTHNHDVRVAVLGGVGPSFCSGHDLKTISKDPQYAHAASTAEGRYWQELRLFVEPLELFRSLPIPTICRVQGHCLAAGLMFVAAADFVIAGEHSSFGSPVLAQQAVNDAEVPIFSWRVGERRAKQALWLNERFDAQEALRIGLANWVVPEEQLDEKVESVADRLLAVSRDALALSKASFQFMAERQGERDFSRFHYFTHQLSHHTTDAISALTKRMGEHPRDPGPDTFDKGIG